ncbi:MAG TPA: PIN domain-containing protein [Gemmatimonadales bacterium]|nr:PIN domain-containing protein [Gemmatimonadales bacterium]
MALILDSSVLVAGERGSLDLAALLDHAGAEAVAMAAITASELLLGYHRATTPGMRARRGAFVEALLASIPVLPFGVPEARRHAELWAGLLQAGTMIGPHDLLIAATALARGDGVATLNRSEFGRIAGLRLVELGRFMK